MAHIVQLRAVAARGAEGTEVGRVDGAEIVIFPGVRRERHVEPEADMAGNQKPQGDRTRDWLELREELPTACP